MTTVKSVHRDLVEALAARDLVKAHELNETMPPEEHHVYNRYLTAVFALLIDDHFGKRLNLDTVAEFADRLREDYDDSAAPSRRLAIEEVILASAGNTSLFEDLTGEDIVATQVMVIGKLGSRGAKARPDLGRFLDEAESVLADWEQ